VRVFAFVSAAAVVLSYPHSVAAQRGAPPSVSAANAAPPATKLEAFKPAAGSLITFGYDELGKVSGVSVDVREVRDATGARVRGLLVAVTESEYRKEQAFVDADEIPELLRGIDALLKVKANPTTFKNFEVRYITRGELRLVAFNSDNVISYSVDAGRVGKASAFLDASEVVQLRAMFAAAAQKLKAP
jgi:hypothetical protein